MNQSFSIKSVILSNFDLVKKNLKFFVLLTLGAWVVQFIPSYINSQITNPIAGFIVSLISWLVDTAVTIGLITISLKYLRSNNASFQDALAHKDKYIKYLLGSIYYSVIVLVGIILLIVPGVIWALRYQFYGYLILDQGLSVKEALAKSKELTQGKLWQLFLFSLALVGVNLLGVLVLGIGLLISVPVSLLAVATVYQKLSGSAPASAAQTTPTQPLVQNPTNVWKSLRQN